MSTPWTIGTEETVEIERAVGVDRHTRVLESPKADSTIRGELLPVEGERFILRAAAVGDGGFDYLHMGARLYRRMV